MPRTFSFFFFFNDTATTEIYTLSLHDALPISWCSVLRARPAIRENCSLAIRQSASTPGQDRKSTRLNSSHGYISYAVFCLKKKKLSIRQHRELQTCSTCHYTACTLSTYKTIAA